MSHLQALELCDGIKKTLWELCQVVTTDIPVKECLKLLYELIGYEAKAYQRKAYIGRLHEWSKL